MSQLLAIIIAPRHLKKRKHIRFQDVEAYRDEASNTNNLKEIKIYINKWHNPPDTSGCIDTVTTTILELVILSTNLIFIHIIKREEQPYYILASQ